MSRAIKILLALGTVIAIAIVFFVGFGLSVYWSLRSSEVKVPDVVGKDRFVAENELTGAGLNFRVRAVRPSNQAKADSILFQLPRAGEVVKAGQTVAVDVSRPAKEGEASDPVNHGDNTNANKPAENDNTNKPPDNLNENKPKRTRNSNSNNANGNANTGNRNATSTRPKPNANANNGNANAEGNANRRTNSNRAADGSNQNSNRPKPNANRSTPPVQPPPRK